MNKVLAFLLVLFAQQAFGTTYKVQDPKRVVRIEGEIGRNVLQIAEKLQKLSMSKKPVVLVISSPGGSVDAGNFLISALQILRARKVPTVCVVTFGAASMAFQLLPYCTERLAFPKSLLMFHPMRAQVGRGAALSADDARNLANELDRSEQPAKKVIQQMLCLDDKTFQENYTREYLWTAEELVAASGCNWLTLVDDVEGIGPVIFADPTAKQAPQGEF